MITIAGSFSIFLLALYRLKLGLYLFVFLLPFYPRSIAFAVGDSGLALTERRLAMIMLISVFIVNLVLSAALRERLKDSLKCVRIVVFLMVSSLAVKLLSTMLNTGATAAAYWADELLFSLGIFMIVITLIQSRKDENRMFMIMIVGVLISGILSILEQYKGAPLLHGLITVDVDEAGRESLAGRMRDNHYRGQGLFDNPLLLAEYACLMIPWSIYYVMNKSVNLRWIPIVSLILTPYILWSVYSRSGYLIGLMILLIVIMLLLYKRMSFVLRMLIVSVLLCIGVAGAYLSLSIILNPEMFFYGKSDSAVSAIERISQYVLVVSAISQSPLIGFGLMQNFTTDLDFLNHLDNYWLRILLEGGVVALILFIALNTVLLKVVFQRIRLERITQERVFYISLFAFYVGFALYKLFISMPTNNLYFYMITALFASRLTNERQTLQRVMLIK